MDVHVEELGGREVACDGFTAQGRDRRRFDALSLVCRHYIETTIMVAMEFLARERVAVDTQ